MVDSHVFRRFHKTGPLSTILGHSSRFKMPLLFIVWLLLSDLGFYLECGEHRRFGFFFWRRGALDRDTVHKNPKEQPKAAMLAALQIKSQIGQQQPERALEPVE